MSIIEQPTPDSANEGINPFEVDFAADGEDPSSRVTIANLLSDSAIYGIAKIVDPAIGFALLPVVTSLLHPEDYGLLSLFTATSHVMFTLCSLGIHQSFLRYFTEAKNSPDQQAVANSAVVLAIIYWLIVAPFLLYFASPISNLLFEINSPVLVYVLLAVSLVQTLDALGSNLLQASGRAFAYLVNTIFSTITVRLLALILILQGAGAWGWITGEAIGRTVAMSLVVFVAMPWVRLRTTKTQAKDLAWYGVMLVPAMLSFYIMTITDKFLIRVLADSPFEQVGLYTVGERIAGIMHMANLAIILGWQRFAFRNMHEEGGGSLIGYGWFVYMLGAGYMVLGLTLLGNDLTHLTVSEQYTAGLAVIIPLTLAAFSGGLANMCDVGLHKRRWPHLISAVTTSAAVANIGLNFLFIPRYGIQGAAWATFICQTLRLVVIYIASQFAFYIKIDVWRIGLVVVTYSAMFLVGRSFDAFDWITAGVAQTIILAITPFVVWWLPILNDDERFHIRAMIRRVLSVLSLQRYSIVKN